MFTPPDSFFELVCDALTPRCGGGRAMVEALGQPYGARTIGRWVAAELLSALEGERLLELARDGAGAGAILRLISPTETTAHEGSEWDWSVDEDPTLPEARISLSSSEEGAGLSWSWGAEGSAEIFGSFERLETEAGSVGKGLPRFALGEPIVSTRFFEGFTARDHLLGRDLVVHRHRDDSPLSKEAFIKAARRQGALQHPNIQPVYELSYDAFGAPLFATSQRLPQTLEDVLKALGRDDGAARDTWTLLRLLETLLDVARAIAFAHRQGVMHRDLRPRDIRIGVFGEVRLGGWFRARGTDDEPDLRADAELNLVRGGLGYLAPERLTKGLSACGHAADVWGLGALLYAMLCYRPPIAGKGAEAVAQLEREGVVRPGARCGRELPEVLESLAMQTLTVDPAGRRMTAEAFASEIEDYLEGTRAEARRLEQTDEQLEDAQYAAHQFEGARERLRLACEDEAQTRAEGATTDHAAAYALRRRVDGIRREAETWFTRADAGFLRALAVLPGHEVARYGICALYFQALQEQERARLNLPRGFLRATILQLDPGGFAAELDALTHLELNTEIPGARVRFFQYRAVDGVLEPDAGREMGVTPFALARLRPGAYLIELERDGLPRVRVSVCLRRGERLSLQLRLPAQIPEGFVHVPDGPFLAGADGEWACQHGALPRGACDLVAFDIARDLTDMGAYHTYLNVLWRDEPARAAACAPRAFAKTAPIWTPDETGYRLPFVDADGREWTAAHPVVGLNLTQVEAYLRWLRERDGRPYRLPTELEWEKAARGAEGRRYPWGALAEPAHCVHAGASGGVPRPLPTGSCPADTSVYGARDMAGCVREYTDSIIDGAPGLRGGSWADPFDDCALASRSPLTPGTSLLTVGFRLALDGPRGPAAQPPEIQVDRNWPLPHPPPQDTLSQPSIAGAGSAELTIEGRSLLLSAQGAARKPLRPSRTEEHSLDTSPERYVIVEEIARGSMGRVVLAYDDVLERHVALKILHDKHSGDQLSCYRFAMEARITGRLQHPAMVPIYDMGRLAGGQRFFAMKLVEGLTLHAVLKGRLGGDRRVMAEFGRDRLLTVTRRVCQGVAFAHAKQVVHRDLKPANILIGELGEVVVVDLGLARQMQPDASDLIDVAEAMQLAQSDGRVTRVGSVIGTPYYMSPEQAMGLQDMVGPHSDVYGVGAILYHILTNRPPFGGKKIGEVLAKVRRGNPTPPSVRAPDLEIPQVLDGIVMRALSTDPEGRQGSVLTIAAELAAYQESTRLRRVDRALTERRAHRALTAFATVEREQGRLDQLREGLQRLRAQLEKAEPVERRRRLWQGRAQLEVQQDRVEAAIADTTRRARLVLGATAEEPEVRRRLQHLLQTQYLRAERARDQARKGHYGRQLSALDEDGSLAHWMHRGATLRVDTTPSRLPSAIYRTQSDGRSLRGDDLVFRSVTPLRLNDAPIGGGIVLITAVGATARIPFVSRRDRPLDLQIEWPDAPPAGFVTVMGGRFLYGGDPEQDEGIPARAAQLPTYHIGVHPVSCIEYHTWLDELRGLDPDKARVRQPRLGVSGEPLWGPAGSESFGGFAPHRPVTGITLADAHAYAKWRSRRDGRRYRLPTSAEWEKAARGVDGRLWPWGDVHEPSFYRSERLALRDVGTFPEDRSPYGVQELVAGVMEWTLTAAKDDPAACYVRGGCSALVNHHQPITYRMAGDPRKPSPFIGFRLVCAAGSAPGRAASRTGR